MLPQSYLNFIKYCVIQSGYTVSIDMTYMEQHIHTECRCKVRFYNMCGDWEVNAKLGVILRHYLEHSQQRSVNRLADSR